MAEYEGVMDFHYVLPLFFIVVQSLSCPTPCDPMDRSTPGFPCPSISPGVCSNSCPLSQWCHPATSFSVVPFSSCPQSFPASGSFPMSQLFASGGQNIRASASTSVLPMNIQGWFPLGLTGLISLQSKGLPRVFSREKVKLYTLENYTQLTYALVDKLVC